MLQFLIIAAKLPARETKRVSLMIFYPSSRRTFQLATLAPAMISAQRLRAKLATPDIRSSDPLADCRERELPRREPS